MEPIPPPFTISQPNDVFRPSSDKSTQTDDQLKQTNSSCQTDSNIFCSIPLPSREECNDTNCDSSVNKLSFYTCRDCSTSSSLSSASSATAVSPVRCVTNEVIAQEADRLAKLGEQLIVESANKTTHGDRLLISRALSLFTAAITLQKTKPGYYSKRSMCHLTLGNVTKALDDANTALKFNPDDVVYLERKASALLAGGRLGEAMSVVEAILKLSPESREANELQQEISSRKQSKQNSEVKVNGGLTMNGQPSLASWAKWNSEGGDMTPDKTQAAVHFILGADEDDASTISSPASRASKLNLTITTASPSRSSGALVEKTSTASSSLPNSSQEWFMSDIEVNKSGTSSVDDVFTSSTRSSPPNDRPLTLPIVMPPPVLIAIDNKWSSAFSNVITVKGLVSARLPLYMFVDDVYSKVFDAVEADFCFRKKTSWNYCLIQFPSSPKAATAAQEILAGKMGLEASVGSQPAPRPSASTMTRRSTSSDTDDLTYYCLRQVSPLIRIDNFDSDSTVEQLVDLFATTVKIWRDEVLSTVAYAQFTNTGDAQKALNKYQNQVLGQCELVMRYAHAKSSY